MYIAYIDDSGSSGTNLEDKQVPFQVIGGPVVDEATYFHVNLVLAQEVANVVPEEQWDEFEFHASHLYYAKPPFDGLGRDKCLQLIETALKWINNANIPIIYGAIDKPKLRKELFRTADPADMSFQIYINGLYAWFEKKHFTQSENPRGFLICDDVRTHKGEDSKKEGTDRRGDIRSVIERAFRRNWKRRENQGISLFLFDDIYFGNSKNSRGLQMADLCVYFIARHLAERSDSEGFYKIIKDQIVFSGTFPAEASIMGEFIPEVH